jgi:hypothetical protein
MARAGHSSFLERVGPGKCRAGTATFECNETFVFDLDQSMSFQTHAGNKFAT